MRRIKNSHKLTKEGLIISPLNPESSNAERNYMKHFNKNNNNNNNNNNSNDNTYDCKIRDKTTDIRMIPNRLRNIVASNDRKKKYKKAL